MNLFAAISHRKQTLKRKLFVYMLLLAAVLLLTLFTALFLFGRFHSIEADTYDALDIQLDSFEKDISTYFDHLAAASLQLSDQMGSILDVYLYQNRITVDDLTDSPDHLTAVQTAMLEPLRQKLLRESCSGSFVMLDATVNSALPEADASRAGLYLQTNGYDMVGENILLYRGPADLAKANGMMPHRKWRLEFSTERFPNFPQIEALSQLPTHEAYFLTDLTVLPGTSEQVLLLVMPICGAKGTFYGYCGLEVCASYFLSYHAQPSRIPHLTCLLAPDGDTLRVDESLSCGVSGGYYRAPEGTLTSRDADGLRCFRGEDAAYMGVTRTISLTPNNDPHALAVLIPKEDYDRSARTAALQNFLLWLLILVFAVNCCLYFSRKFLSPILTALEQLKAREHAETNISELNDLSEALSQQDKAYEENLRALTMDYENARSEISRLSYRVRQEVDQEGYQYFRSGLQDLTPTEHRIFDLYLDGKTAKEIQELLQIKENTLKFHNKGIYSKLGVHSRKQLLQYAELMKQEQQKC